MQWLYLAIAIVSEVVATSALKAANGFARWEASLLVVTGYVSAFYIDSALNARINKTCDGCTKGDSVT